MRHRVDARGARTPHDGGPAVAPSGGTQTGRAASGRRLLLVLLLVAIGNPTLPARADLVEAEGKIGLSAPALSWAVRFPVAGYRLEAQRHWPDGRGHYYMFVHEPTGMAVSFYIEPADRCPDAHACRDFYWRNRHASMRSAHGVTRSERNGFALIEFLTEYQVPQVQGRTVQQFHLSGHWVRDGYWVDLHLSKMPYAPKDRQGAMDVVDSLTIEPKGP
jgi:hypothetical protein